MESYFTPSIYIPILIAICAGVVYYFYQSSHKKRVGIAQAKEAAPADDDKLPEVELASVKQFPKNQPVLCFILDNIIGREYNAYVNYKAIVKTMTKWGTLGRVWNRDGKSVLALFKTDDNEYKPLVKPTNIINAATTLWEDTQQHEVPILFDVSEDKSFMDKYGVWIWWLAVMAFIGVMYVQGN